MVDRGGDLQSAPSWRATETVERVALLPTNGPGSAAITRIELVAGGGP